jgi:deazaflavin-dependent oxidoreductase (nitroreductase family)
MTVFAFGRCQAGVPPDAVPRHIPEMRCVLLLVLTIGMPVQGEYEPSASAWVREQVELFESSGGTKGTTLRDSGIPVVVVTNLGASSGKVRKTPVMRVEHDGRYAMVASKGGAPEHPLWYYNVRANPLVELQDGARRQDMIAREISGDERAEWWERAVKVFPSYAEYQQKTTREIPVFVLEPTAES